MDEAALRTRLAAGVETADGTYEADLLGFEPPATVCVGVAEGKHRMVRRMLANAGTCVWWLSRVSWCFRSGHVLVWRPGIARAQPSRRIDLTPASTQ